MAAVTACDWRKGGVGLRAEVLRIAGMLLSREPGGSFYQDKGNYYNICIRDRRQLIDFLIFRLKNIGESEVASPPRPRGWSEDTVENSHHKDHPINVIILLL